MARRLAAPLTALFVLLAAAAPAAADLRSTRVDSSCPSGYTYGEHTVGKWTVEGCAKAGTASGDVEEKWLFDGTVEASGMLIEHASGSGDLIATEEQVEEGNRSFEIGRLKRTDSTRLVVDPLIGSTRRKFTIYTGSIDLVAENDTQAVQTGLRSPLLRAAQV